MQDAFGVGRFEGFGGRRSNGQQFIRRQRPLRIDVRFQAHAVEVIHDQEWQGFAGVGVVAVAQADDGWMAQLLKRCASANTCHVAVQFRQGQRLDDQRLTQVRVLAEKDDAEAAGSEDALRLVFAEGEGAEPGGIVGYGFP